MADRSPLWAEVTVGGAQFWFGSGGKAETALSNAIAKGVQVLEQTEEGGLLATDAGTELFLALFGESVRDWENLSFRGELVPFSKAAIPDLPADLRVNAAVLSHFEWQEQWGNASPPAEPPTGSMPPP